MKLGGGTLTAEIVNVIVAAFFTMCLHGIIIVCRLPDTLQLHIYQHTPHPTSRALRWSKFDQINLYFSRPDVSIPLLQCSRT